MWYVVLDLYLDCIVVNLFYNVYLDLVFNYFVVFRYCFRIFFESFDGRSQSVIGKFIVAG